MKTSPMVAHLVALAVGFTVSLAGAFGLFGSYRAWPGEPLLLKLVMLFMLPTTAAVIGHLIGSLQRNRLAGQENGSADAAIAGIVSWVSTFLIGVHLMLVPSMYGGVGVAPIGKRLVVILLGITLAAIGNLLPRTRPNMAIGIRTSRTLADRQLWILTHRSTGYAAVVVGAVTIGAGLFLRGPLVAAVPSIVMALAAAVLVALYVKRVSTMHAA